MPISLILLATVSYVFVGIYRLYALNKNILDHPNQRSSHSAPIPRGGGIVFPVLWSIFLLFLYFSSFLDVSYLYLFLPPIFLLSIVSFLDDKYGIHAQFRFLTQLVAAVYVLFTLDGFSVINLGIISLNWGWFGLLIMCFALLWSTNLYNFMDGIDGIAAIEALFVFGFGGYFIWLTGGVGFALLIWGIAAIVFGFLLWNKPPAKIFMGDVGSALLGFLVILVALVGEKKYNVPFLIWMILYGVFWFDATVTLIRRMANGEKWYQAHRLHAYQRLQLQDWSHARILLGVATTNLILAGLAFLSFYFSEYVLLFLFGALAVLTVNYLLVEKIQPMYLK